MRKLRLVAVIVLVAWGSHTLYKYFNDDIKIFVSDDKLPEKLPENELPEIIVEQVQTPVEDVKPIENVEEIIEKSLTDDAIEIKVEETKPLETVLAETIKEVDIYKKDVHKPIKRKKFKYCVKVKHNKETTHDIIMRHFIND